MGQKGKLKKKRTVSEALDDQGLYRQASSILADYGDLSVDTMREIILAMNDIIMED